MTNNIRGAVVENGTVTNVWMVPSLDCFDGITLLDAPDTVSVGWSYDGTSFHPPEVDPIPELVPESITMRQCRLHLLYTGKLALVAPAIASLPSPQKEAAEIEWEYGSVVMRNSPLIDQLSSVLGWDNSAEIDEQFIVASKL